MPAKITESTSVVWKHTEGLVGGSCGMGIAWVFKGRWKPHKSCGRYFGILQKLYTDNGYIAVLENELKETEKGIANLIKVIEKVWFQMPWQAVWRSWRKTKPIWKKPWKLKIKIRSGRGREQHQEIFRYVCKSRLWWWGHQKQNSGLLHR